MKIVSGICSAPMSWTTSNPVFPGICTSRNTRSGLTRRIVSTASSPVVAIPAISMPFSFARRSSIRWRASGSSSAITTRNVSAMHRNHDRGNRSAAGSRSQSQRSGAAVQLRQTRACVRQADSRRLDAHSRAVVPHCQNETAPVPMRGDVDPPLPCRPADAMLECILHDWLQHQAGHGNLQSVRIDLHLHAEASLKTDLHDVDIPLQKIELLPQRHGLRPTAVDRIAEKIAQSGDHASHAGRIAFYERGDSIQSIEQKVRIDLRPQRIEARIRELRVQRDRLSLALLVPKKVLPRIAPGEHGEIDQELIHETKAAEIEPARESWHFKNLGSRKSDDEGDDQSDQTSDGYQHRNAPGPSRPFDAEAAAEREDERSEGRPQPPLQVRHGDRPGWREQAEAEAARIEKLIDDRERRQRRPEDEDDRQLPAAQAPMGIGHNARLPPVAVLRCSSLHGGAIRGSAEQKSSDSRPILR